MSTDQRLLCFVTLIMTTVSKIGLQGSSGSELQIVPKVATVLAGETATFRCSKEPNAELPIGDWMHRPVGAVRRIHVYSSALQDIENSYEPYVSVHNNQTLGEYDLVITNAQLFHAGIYYCVDSDKQITTVDAVLEVIDGKKVRIVPRTASVRVGESASFSCWKEPNAEYPIAFWEHRSVDGGRKVTIYSSALDDIENSYEPYVSIHDNQTTGEYELVINDVQTFLAGTFYCVDSDKNQTTAETELIVTSAPLCYSSASFDDPPMVDNDCSWEPDEIQLNCTVQYKGHRAPVLLWTDNENPTRIFSNSVSNSESDVLSSLVLKGNSLLDGKSFVCRLENDAKNAKESHLCHVEKINILYAYAATTYSELQNVPTESAPFTCNVNTSLTNCVYEWRTVEEPNGPHQGTYILKNRVIAVNQMNLGEIYQCSATCTFKGRSCLLKGNLLRLMKSTGEIDNLRNYYYVIVVVGLAFIISAVVVIICIRYRKIKRKRSRRVIEPTYETLASKQNNDIQLIQSIPINGETGIAGVVWFENRIYVIGYNEEPAPRPMKIFVFLADHPYTEIDVISLDDIGFPENMEFSDITKSLYISDWGDKTCCLWLVHLQDKKVEKWKLVDNPSPGSLSISSDGNLHVVVKLREYRFRLDSYTLHDQKRVRSVQIPNEHKKLVERVWHAIQGKNGRFIFAYEVQDMKLQSKERRIGLLSVQHSSVPLGWDESIELGLIEPVHLSISQNYGIFVADINGHNVIEFESDLKPSYRTVLANDQHEIHQPARLFYLQARDQLIVGQWSSSDRPVTVTIFKLL